MEEQRIGCLAKYIDLIKKGVEELTRNHRAFLESEPLIAFRGEAEDYGETKLTPSLFRNSTYVDKEAHLFELFCDYDIVNRSASNIEKAIETQHYASISRMLDITFDLLVALYFTCKESKTKDGFIHIFAFPEHYSPHSKYIEEFYTNVLENKHIAYSRNFKVFSHSFTNERIKAQKGGFIFFPGKEFCPINTCYYRTITISKDDKATILHDLEVLFQLTEATLFPEKDKIAEIIKYKFKNNSYAQKNVSIENEIETFFDRIDYELKILRIMDETEDNKKIVRWLRKEQDDLSNYVLKYADYDCIDQLMQQIDRNFQILQIRYMEVRYGKKDMG